MDLPVSPERRFVIWIGALLLDRGHVVEIRNGAPLLVVHTRKHPKRLWVGIQQDIATPGPRVPVGTVADLEEHKPDAVILVTDQSPMLESIRVVPKSTKEAWLNEGRHYTVETTKLVDLETLQAWLTQAGRPA